MLSTLTRTRVIQGWFGAVALVVVATVTFGAAVTASTGVLLVTLSFVPPFIVFLLWPENQSVTAGEVIRGTDRRT